MKKKKKRVIGRNEIIDLPDLGLYNIASKIDTGARSSVIHCHCVSVVVENKIPFLVFKLLDPTCSTYADREFKTTDFFKRWIKNSFGEREERYFVKSNVLLNGSLIPVEFSLCDRRKMKYPILLGRRFLKDGRFIVDIGRNNIFYKKSNGNNR